MKFYLSVISFLFVLPFYSVGQMPIHYVSPTPSEILNENAISILKSRVISFSGNNGISGEGGHSDIVIYPIVNEIENKMIEGMKNIILYTIEVQLIVKEVKTKNIYGSITLTSKGDGFNKYEAVSSAVSKLDFDTSQGKKFISDVKTEIHNYYESNCETLLNKANTLSKSGNYEAAISVCYSIPESVNCYSSALSTALSCYGHLQEAKCKSQLIKADGYATSRMYSQAIIELTKIDPNTSCYSEVAGKLNSIDKKLSEIEQTERERIQYERKVAEEKSRNENELEKSRINAIKDIAIAYYKNQPKTIYKYNYIIAY